MIFPAKILILNSNFAADRWRCKHQKYLDTLFLLELRLRSLTKKPVILSIFSDPFYATYATQSKNEESGGCYMMIIL